jgi:hypothetical protein
MSFKKTFCSSPWFHMRIDSDGALRYCRGVHKKDDELGNRLNVRDISPKSFFQNTMSTIRTKILNGETIPSCSYCYKMEEHNKISTRQKQLLKTGIQIDNFEKTIKSSPFFNEFELTAKNCAHTNLLPQDWQIDLGNFCNSACIFCSPRNSSKLANEFLKLGLIKNLPGKNWVDNPELLQNFISLLEQSEKIVYIHFLGGETVITPAFKTILEKLIKTGMNKNISIGFTTNLTVFREDIIELLIKFKEVNLGMSIECLHQINDYLRWPSKIDEVKIILEKWLEVARKHRWLVQLRPTPTVFSIKYLQSLYEYAFEKQISIESCNFLHDPEFLKMSLLPIEDRQPIIENFKNWIKSKKRFLTHDTTINTRDPNVVKNYLLQDAQSYINYLESTPEDIYLWPKLIEYLKKLERSRNNSILNYIPEYEKLLRSSGY